eukprot:PhM_4_TR17523/c0_g1_i1/m.71792
MFSRYWSNIRGKREREDDCNRDGPHHRGSASTSSTFSYMPPSLSLPSNEGNAGSVVSPTLSHSQPPELTVHNLIAERDALQKDLQDAKTFIHGAMAEFQEQRSEWVKEREQLVAELAAEKSRNVVNVPVSDIPDSIRAPLHDACTALTQLCREVLDVGNSLSSEFGQRCVTLQHVRRVVQRTNDRNGENDDDKTTDIIRTECINIDGDGDDDAEETPTNCVETVSKPSREMLVYYADALSQLAASGRMVDVRPSSYDPRARVQARLAEFQLALLASDKEMTRFKSGVVDGVSTAWCTLVPKAQECYESYVRGSEARRTTQRLDDARIVCDDLRTRLSCCLSGDPKIADLERALHEAQEREVVLQREVAEEQRDHIRCMQHVNRIKQLINEGK